MRLVYEAQPRPRAITSLAGETIVKVACGTNHTGDCYSMPNFSYLSLFITCPYYLFWIFSGGGSEWLRLHVSNLLVS